MGVLCAPCAKGLVSCVFVFVVCVCVCLFILFVNICMYLYAPCARGLVSCVYMYVCGSVCGFLFVYIVCL